MTVRGLGLPLIATTFLFCFYKDRPMELCRASLKLDYDVPICML
jgi:hypothetical protein